MREEIKNKMLSVLDNHEIKEIIELEDFYFQKAIDKYDELMKMPKLENNITEKIINKIKNLSNNNSFSHLSLMNEFEEHSLEYKTLYKIGELIAYIDSHGFNKKEFNKYEDKRTIARAGVRQHNFVVNLLRYKESENIEDLNGAVKNVIKYIINPKKIINILSEKHRKLIKMFIFQEHNEKVSFDDLVLVEMNSLNIVFKNELNRLVVYSKILYSEEIKQFWEHNQNIWKISHGYGAFEDVKRELYLKEKIVTVHKDTKKSQGKNFAENLKKGDLFYLCYGSEVKLIGIITSDVFYDEEGWAKRYYEVVKQSINSNRYVGINKGWAPNYNSTFAKVKEEHLKIFEKELLLPYFNMTLQELFDDSEIEDLYIEKDLTMINTVSNYSEVISKSLFENLNYILYGPPGTGKTYNTINYAIAMIENREFETVEVEKYSEIKEKFEKLKEKEQIVFTTFHQSYGYEEFIEGIKPILNKENGGEISYNIESGVFKKVCEEAQNNIDKNYVVIIDEINRGNISKIFGELITLIEKTKRIGMEEESESTLPYSKAKFGVPKNVYILGTMNTADRSIALLDTALRRRFEFIEMMPDSNIFKKINGNEELLVEDINIKEMLDIINKRIEILYDREHTIGQAYFMELINDQNVDALEKIFTHKIIPLLQEYFYDDYEKIRLILADNQIKNEELQFINVCKIPKKLFGNNFEDDILEDKKVYVINKAAFTNPLSYIKIYSLDIEGIIND